MGKVNKKWNELCGTNLKRMCEMQVAVAAAAVRGSTRFEKRHRRKISAFASSKRAKNCLFEANISEWQKNDHNSWNSNGILDRNKF